MRALDDTVVLVTGASGGIGKAFAGAFLKAGARVVLTDRDADKLEAARASLDGDTVVLAIDVTERGSEHRLIEHAVETFGRLDIVLNNAGMMVVGAYDDIDVDQVSSMVSVNVEAAYRIGFAALRHFKHAGTGYLINTSSIAGVKAAEKTGAYAGTKAAIEAFTEGLRLEVAGTGIGVAVIEPGTVETGLFDDMSDEDKATYKAGELLKPEDIADAAIFIATRPAHVRIPRMLVVPASQAF